MKKINLITLSVILATSLLSATSQDTPTNNQVAVAVVAPIVYQETTTGVEIVFSKDGKNWDKIIANGESELLFGDRKDVRKATSKAILRAKANIAKFMEEKLTTAETLEEITKTISKSTNNNGKVLTGTERKTVETVIESISNSSEAILKGILVIEQQINQKDKYVKVQVGVSRKTIKIADNISNDMYTDLSESNKDKDTVTPQYNNGENEIKRSKNYNNF